MKLTNLFAIALVAGFGLTSCGDDDTTDPPASITYASVVSRESVRIALMLAALNGLEVKGADAQNAHLNAQPKEHYWIRCGPEFGHNQGKRAKIVRALYGLKSSPALPFAGLAHEPGGSGGNSVLKSGFPSSRIKFRPDLHTIN